SVVAAGLPILTALIGVGLGISLITAATGFIDMSSTAPTLAIMLGLAVGIDYALFIVTRHRQLLRTGLTPEESAARAVGTAGSAVVFAGAVVVIALLGLLVVGIPFLSVMGIAAAGTVTVDRKSTRLNSSHVKISYAVFCLKKKQHTESWFMY